MANGTNTNPPSTSSFSWGALMRKIWGDEYHKPPVAYEFTNGRKFESSEENGGPYHNVT